jgi:hypothetical protein
MFAQRLSTSGKPDTDTMVQTLITNHMLSVSVGCDGIFGNEVGKSSEAAAKT